MYKANHFKLYELLPRWFYERNKHLGDKLWLMFDDRVLWTADQLWKLYGPTVVANDWYWGGSNQYRGWRPWNCKVGANLSQHKFGRALDQKFKYATAEEVRQKIKKEYFLPTLLNTNKHEKWQWTQHNNKNYNN